MEHIGNIAKSEMLIIPRLRIAKQWLKFILGMNINVSLVYHMITV